VFLDLWPVLQYRMQDKEERIDFIKALLKDFVDRKVDLSDIAAIHEDIRCAIRELQQAS